MLSFPTSNISEVHLEQRKGVSMQWSKNVENVGGARFIYLNLHDIMKSNENEVKV